ncbi:hypothetical protein B566_EDAN007974 [Ephemera danica]|nr:hypothetical protein B566_EDAN007974 [Ephemera danica]
MGSRRLLFAFVLLFGITFVFAKPNVADDLMMRENEIDDDGDLTSDSKFDLDPRYIKKLIVLEENRQREPVTLPETSAHTRNQRN